MQKKKPFEKLPQIKTIENQEFFQTINNDVELNTQKSLASMLEQQCSSLGMEL